MPPLVYRFHSHLMFRISKIYFQSETNHQTNFFATHNVNEETHKKCIQMRNDMCMHCSRVVWWSLCNALDMTRCACELCKVPIHVASARLARKSRAHFRAKAQHARYCTYMIFTCGNNRPPSDTDWSLEWHDILHQWNVRVQDLPSAAAIKRFLHKLDVVQRRMLRSIVGWVRIPDEPWENTMRRMNQRMEHAAYLHPLPSWSNQIF